jgi:hypothetical protein
MKYPTSGQIIAKALYNIYGDSTPAASIQEAALHKFYDILDRCQREHTFFFSRQRDTFAITSGTADYAVIGAIFSATSFGKLGKIYGISIKRTTPKLLNALKRIGDEELDAYSLNMITGGTPCAYCETFMREVPTDHIITLWPTPNADLTGIIYYKRIYLPEDWTDVEYTHFILDELCDYLVHRLTAEMCADAQLKEKAADHFSMAANYLKSVLARNDDYWTQDNDGRIKPQ